MDLNELEEKRNKDLKKEQKSKVELTVQPRPPSRLGPHMPFRPKQEAMDMDDEEMLDDYNWFS